MTSFIIWLYVALAISCFFLFFAWSHYAHCFVKERSEEGHPLSSLVWSKSFLVAGGLALHAIALFFATGYRVVMLYRNPSADIVGEEPYIFAFFLLMILLSKVVLIWAASTDELRKKIRWPWVAYVGAMLSATVLVFLRVPS